MASRKPARSLAESPESASPAITRAVAAALSGTPFDLFVFKSWEKAILRSLGLLPPSVGRAVAAWDAARKAFEPEAADELDLDQLIQARLEDYRELSGPFDAVVLGAALGGAAAHLCAALRAPFLPQPFVLSFRGGSRDDDILPHFEKARGLAEPILRNNPSVLLISHFDPLHDGWLTRRINHVRLKLLHLPPAYQEFLRERLKPGGAIIDLDCQAVWPQYVLEPRHVYQVGGWGGIPAREYIEGSERIDEALASARSRHRGGWRLEPFQPVDRPESEWGSEKEFGLSLEDFAARNGFRFHRITFRQPTDFSRLAFEAHLELFRRASVEPTGALVEIFTHYEPSLAIAARLAPLWLVFHTTDGLEFLSSMADRLPAGRPVLFSGLVTFSRTPDVVPLEEWERSVAAHPWINLGPAAERYPEDLPSLWRWVARLRAWARDTPPSAVGVLTAEELVALAEGMAEGAGDLDKRAEAPYNSS